MPISELVKSLEQNRVKFAVHGENHDKRLELNGNTFSINRDKNKDYGKKMVEAIQKQNGMK